MTSSSDDDQLDPSPEEDPLEELNLENPEEPSTYQSPGARARHEMVRRIAYRTEVVTVNGKKVKMPLIQLYVRTVRGKAMKGDAQFAKLTDQLRNISERSGDTQPRAVAIFPERYTDEDFHLRYSGGPDKMTDEEFLEIKRPQWAEQEAAWNAKNKRGR